MKKTISMMFAITLISTAALAQEVTPDMVIQAIDQMSPEQVDQLYTKLAKSYWEPIPEGFFSRFGARIDAAFIQYEDVGLNELGLSSKDLDVEDGTGAEVTLLWQVLAPEFRFGLRFGGQGSRDSDSGAAGYSRVELYTGYGALVANYQLVRAEHWLLWLEGGIGAGWAGMETLNTPAGSASTVRELDGDYVMGDARLGASWRFNPILSLHVTAGYTFADEVDLEEGGQETAITVDPSGFLATIGLGITL